MRYVYGLARPKHPIIVPEPSLLADWKSYERKNERASKRYTKDTKSIDRRYDHSSILDSIEGGPDGGVGTTPQR
jgi:hypothetical protein